MAISLATNLARPKLAQTVSVPVSLDVGDPIEADGSDSFTQYVTLEGIEPVDQTVSCTGNSGETTLTAASGHDIRIGDVASGTGIASGAVVTDVVNNTITLDLANTGAVSGNVVFAPPTTSARIIGIQGNFTVAGTKLNLRLRLYAPSGETVTGPSDTTVVGEMGSAQIDTTVRVDVSNFLEKVRVPRTNA